MRNPKEIGEIIRTLRGNSSLREFAKKCDVSHTTIDNIEKGIDFRTGKPVLIKMATIEKIAGACNVSISDIIGGDNQASSAKSAIRAIASQDKNGIIFIRGRDGSIVESELDDEKIELFKNMLKQISDKK